MGSSNSRLRSAKETAGAGAGAMERGGGAEGGGARGGEGPPEPEAVLGGDRVRRVGERCGALVGGDDEIGVALVEKAHVGRGDDPAAGEGVRQVGDPPEE